MQNDARLFETVETGSVSRVRRPPVRWLLALAGGVLLAGAPLLSQAPKSTMPARDPARELVMNVSDGFTVAAVGDCIVARPISQTADSTFKSVVRILREADVGFANFETSAFDIRTFTGSPQADYNGQWLIGVPEVARDLKAMGFDMVARAQNHATDWGVEGMRLTSLVLDEAGLVHAGVGEHRAAARAPRYLDTEKGRIALVSFASSFTPLSRAMPPVGEAPGRPGVSALRLRRYVLVTTDELKMLRRLRDEQPSLPGTERGGAPMQADDEKQSELQLFGVWYRVGDKRGVTYEMDPIDEREILRSIRQAKQMSDFVIATIHAHEPGNFSEQPADFLPTLARVAIDAGADEFVAHGPHLIRGIEIYKGKPIFYSLGNFIKQLDLLEPVGMDLYEELKLDPATTTEAELNAIRLALWFPGEVWYQSVVAVSRFEEGQLSEIRLYPVDLGYTMRGANRGVPRLAAPPTARQIVERLRRLSEPFGTSIAIEEDVGVIRPARITANSARQ